MINATIQYAPGEVMQRGGQINRMIAKELRFYPDAIGGLAGHLEGISEPDEDQLETPYTRGDRQKITDDLWNILDGLEDSFKSLYTYEGEQAEKFLPLTPLDNWAVAGPDKLEELDATKGVGYQPVRTVEYWNSLRRLARAVRPSSLNSWDLKTALDSLDLTTNSGYPLMTRRSSVIEAEMYRAKLLLQGVVDDPHIYVMATRASGGGKYRMVWMAEMARNIVEKTIVGPTTNALRGAGFLDSWGGIPTLDKSIQDILNRASDEKALVLSFDESGFDRHVLASHLHDVMSVVYSWFKESDQERIRLASMPERAVLVGPGFARINDSEHFQVYSGHGGTNLLDSLVNVTKLDTVISYLTGKSPLAAALHGVPSIQVNGDDAVVLVPRAFENQLDEFSQVYRQMFAAEVSPTKQRLSSTHAIMNSRLTDLSYKGGQRSVAPIFRRIKLFWPERPVKLNETAKKGISIAEVYAIAAIARLDTLDTHPRFKQMVDYIRDSDKFKLFGASEDLVKKAKRYSKLKSLRVLLDTNKGQGYQAFAGDNSPTVKYLRTGQIGQ